MEVNGMRVERTNDLRSIQSVFNHPAIVRDVWDFGEPKPLRQAPTVYYLLATDEHYSDGAVEDVVIGAMMFVPMNSVTWNPHIAILPAHRGNGTEVMRLGMEWMFENTECKKLVAYPPSFNQRMIRVFEKCGWRHEGISLASFSWNGQIYDRVMLGAENHLVTAAVHNAVRMMG